MSEKKDVEDCPSEEALSQAESYDASKSGTSESYDMKDFCPGIRIEAKDFDGKWYPAKVSDVDWTENEILIHFENWNTKFDEWIPMDSSRLRPLQKPVLQEKDNVKFSKGEEVMAMWSPYQKYPATIQAVLANDRYDVLFYDGFLKRLKSHKISKLEGGSAKNEVRNFIDIGTKEERRQRKRKINVAELFHVNKRSKRKGLVHSKSQDIKTYPVSRSRNKGVVLKKPVAPEENKEIIASNNSSEIKQRDEKLPNSGASVSTKALIDTIPAAFEVKYINGQTEMWSKQLYQRSEGRTAGKLDIVILNPQGRKFRSRNEIMKFCEENGIIYSHEAFDFSAKGRPKSKPALQTPTSKVEASVEDKEKLLLKKGQKRSQFDTPVATAAAAAAAASSSSSSQSFQPVNPTEILPFDNNDQNKVFIGDFEVIIENGKFICPVKTCGKHFRRENLLHMHMKHYHPEFSKYLDSTPSVTDLAYARTVGGLDAAEVSSPAPRKLTEKSEKPSGKVENVRKVNEPSLDHTKETKKLKTSETKPETKVHPVKGSNEVAPSDLGEISIDENQKNKTNVNVLPVRNASNANEFGSNKNEFVASEKCGNSVENDRSSEAANPTDGRNSVSSHAAMKSFRHKLSGRKKSNRFHQGSFSDHLRKKRLISQENSKSQIRVGRQQQSQHQRQQQQQQQQQKETVQTIQTIPPNQSCFEETNSNVSSHAQAMSRYPKPQSNLTNETSGKNNLLSSSKSLERPEVAGRKLKNGERNGRKDGGESIGTREITAEEIVGKFDGRNFMPGSMKARKRKSAVKVHRPRKKMKSETKWRIQSGEWHSFGREPNRDSVDPDGNVEGSKVFDATVDGDVGKCGGETPGKKCLRLKLRRVDETFRTEEDFENATETESENVGNRPENDGRENGKETGEPEIRSAESKNAVAEGEMKTIGNERKCVLLENVFRRESPGKSPKGIPRRENGENVGRNRGDEKNYEFSHSKWKSSYGKMKSGEKSNREKSLKKRRRRRISAKKVRFEKTVMEKLINSDGFAGNRIEISDAVGKTNFAGDPETRDGNNSREDRKKKWRCRPPDDSIEPETFPAGDVIVATNFLPRFDDSGLDQIESAEESKSNAILENNKVEKLRRNEIINCLCGITEEDGLMIQCDLCLCWQHGHCAGIFRESDVPDKYTCAICKNPYRARSSMKYLHDQEWLKEGTLPSLSFRSKRDDVMDQRRTILKRSHDLSGSIALMARVIHSLRLKVNIAEKKDHPKLWLWAKKWTEKKVNRLKDESDLKEEKPEQIANSSNEVKKEGDLTEDEKQLPKAPEPEAPIDSAECKLNLLDHLIHYQTLIDARLSCIESLVAELESMQDDAVNDETPDRYPRTKATVQMLLRDLSTMKKIAII